jgi:hypothetical protein
LSLAEKAKLAMERIKRGDLVISSPQEVIDAMTLAGSSTALQLAEWGVAWLPKHGWRTELERKWRPATDTASLTDAAGDRRSGAAAEEIPTYVTAPDFAYCGAEARA